MVIFQYNIYVNFQHFATEKTINIPVSGNFQEIYVYIILFKLGYYSKKYYAKNEPN